MQSMPSIRPVDDRWRLSVNPDFVAAVKAKAVSLGIDPALACALVEQESGWNPWSIRYEPAFQQRYETNKGHTPTEATARSISWGLFQTMGETVRAVGYKGDLPQLCEVDTGITWGLMVLQSKLKLAGGDVNKGLLYWNGGSNKDYPAQVLARVPKYQA